ncbi:MAG: DUF4861 domain-containing protein [Marinoscillum sp.]
MNRQPFLILGALILLTACGQQPTLVISNKEDYPVYGKRIIVDASEVTGLSTTYFKLSYGGNELPVQFDDLDNDGTWDEVVFELDFAENEAITLTISPSEIVPDYPQQTNVYLGVSPERNDQFGEVEAAKRPKSHVAQSTPYLYQYEGPGWESELVAFRSYFDSRNGKDIFGKTTPQLYVSKIGLGDNYHELSDWGMDVLKVGNSLGSGALAILKNDSLYRLGETDQAEFKAITEGPVRAIMELKYTGWDVAGISYDLTETIEIWAGKRSFTSRIVLTGGSELDTLVTGIVDLKKVEQAELEATGFQVMYTHGKQSENEDVLGMGILVKDSNWLGFDQAPESGEGVTNTYTALLKSSNDLYTFHFFAGWELEHADFASKEKFQEALVKEADCLNANVSVLFNIK